MKQAIIIPTHKKFSKWLYNCLSTIDTKYPVIVVTNTDDSNQFEMAAVKAGLELEIDEFFVMHDTVEIKDNKFFDLIFEVYKGQSVYCNPQGQMFLNKYKREELLRTNLPSVHDKLSAINAESKLNGPYKHKFNPKVLFPEFKDNAAREEKFGRTNMILENEFIKKYKGCWNPNMIK